MPPPYEASATSKTLTLKTFRIRKLLFRGMAFSGYKQQSLKINTGFVERSVIRAHCLY